MVVDKVEFLEPNEDIAEPLSNEPLAVRVAEIDMLLCWLKNVRNEPSPDAKAEVDPGARLSD